MTVETSSKSIRGQGETVTPSLQLVAWEITRSCNLFCAHCRGSSAYSDYDDGLSTEECLRLIDEILAVGRPIIILTGGEPLVRQDVLQIAKYAVNKGLRVVMGSNGTLVTHEMATRLKDIPISRLAISVDFPVANLQDDFRGQPGAFEAAMAGIARAHQAGIQVQINSTITKLNVHYLDELLSLSLRAGAVAFHPFLLVPTGRGKSLQSAQLSPEQYEEVLNWIYDKELELGERMFFKPTDAPHYRRIVKQRQKQSQGSSTLSPEKPASISGLNPVNSITRGCLAGIGFCFISHQGRVQGCGYLDVEAGSVRTQPFSQIWADSPLFNDLRDISRIKGKCGVCEYKKICGGCRARAYEATGDYLEAEPCCAYRPETQRDSY